MTEQTERKCRNHGIIKGADIIKSGVRNGKQLYRCRLCSSKFHRNNYLRNKDKINEKTRLYHARNPEIKKRYNMQTTLFRITPSRTRGNNDSRVEKVKRKLVYLLWDIDKVIQNVNK